MAKATGTTKPNPLKPMLGYFRNVWLELKRVVWPGRTEVLNSSVVVVTTLAFFVLFTFVVDSVVIYVISLVGKIGG